MVVLRGGRRTVIHRVLVYFDVLVVYEHSCVFPEWWSLSRPLAELDHSAHLRVTILRCRKEAQKSIVTRCYVCGSTQRDVGRGVYGKEEL